MERVRIMAGIFGWLTVATILAVAQLISPGTSIA